MDEDILKGHTILVVDDETDLRDIVASELEFMGAKIFQAPNVETAQNILSKNSVDLVVSDIRMPGASGIDLLKYVKSRDVNVPPMILITGFADITTEDAFGNGAEALLSKPFKLEELVQTAHKLVMPVRERFRELATPHRTVSFIFPEALKAKLDRGDCAIGRGGLSMMMDMNSKRMDLNQVMKFQLQFTDVTLEGMAICRWWKVLEQSNRTVMGLEFVYLNDSTLNYCLKFWESGPIIPFIPILG